MAALTGSNWKVVDRSLTTEYTRGRQGSRWKLYPTRKIWSLTLQVAVDVDGLEDGSAPSGMVSGYVVESSNENIPYEAVKGTHRETWIKSQEIALPPGVSET